MKKILTVVGARPQFIKAATVSRAFGKITGLKEEIVHTGQHFDANMSDIFFDEMEIPRPHHHLNINSLGHGAMTGRMMEGLESLILKSRPDLVLVYGDTNSTLAGALTARKLNISVAHVEAGLRSFNLSMPEEVNRILTDRISDMLYCPTSVARENLLAEGFSKFKSKIVVSGDVMYDAVLYYSERAGKLSTIRQKLKLDEYVLCTIHRAENTDDLERLKNIVKSLNAIHTKCRVVLPLHPRTRAILQSNDIRLDFDTIDPVGYFDMITLLANCKLVLTDSGGLQKEAYFFKKYCITMRDETEWVELVKAGVNETTGADFEKILKTFEKMVGGKSDFSDRLYGEGKASEIIASDIAKFLG